MPLNYTTITETFDDGSGVPLSGTVTFTPSSTVYSAGTPLVTPSNPVVAQVINGALKNAAGGALTLLATDNTGLTLEGLTGFWFWSVVVNVGGGSQSWSFFLPHSPSTVDLYSLANTVASGGFTNPMTTPGDLIDGGTAGAAQRLGIGTSGQVLTVSAGAPAWVSPSPALPLTTLGDTVYENATPAPARLAGNTTSTKNFLTQTGTGSVSAAPAWGTIAAGDLPAATTSVQGAVVLDGTAGDIQPSPATQAAGAAGKSADAGHVHGQPPMLAPTGLTGATAASRYVGGTVSGPPSSGTFSTGDHVVDQTGVIWVCFSGGTPGTWKAWGDQPWMFRPESYGAKGNGKVIGDAAIAGGALSTLTSASAAFTSGDTGKTILVNGANGATSAPLITTITFVNATTVTLGTAAANAVTNAVAVYGSDDTAAVNSAVSAAYTYAVANSRKAQIMFGSKAYCLTAATTKGSSGGPTYGNAQIPLQVPDTTGATPKVVIEFAGVGDGSELQYFDGTAAQWAGTCLVSMLNLTSNDATWGVPSVIGGPTAASGTGWSLTGGFANIKPVVTGIKIMTPWNGWQMGLDFRYCAGAYVDKSGWAGIAPISGGQAPLLSAIPSNGNSIALYMPLFHNNDDCKVGTWSVEGAVYGIGFSEHFNAQCLTLIYCNICMYVPMPGAIIHGASILHVSTEASNISLQSGGSAAASFPITIGLLDSEVINTRDIDDASNTFTGLVEFVAIDQAAPRVNGGSNLKVVNNRLGPGYWAGAPAAPASGTSQQNTSWRDATIYVSSTVPVTAVTVDGQATGQTAAAGAVIPVRVAAGHSYVITAATGTQTTKWWLD